MNVQKNMGGWWLVVGVVALGVVAFTFTLQGAPTDKVTDVKPVVASGNSGQGPHDGTSRSNRPFKVGPGLSEFSNLPVLPPVTVDYRKDAPPRVLQSRADRRRQRTPATDGVGTIAAAVACNFGFECDDCNPCTVDACTDQTCTGGERDGFPCQVDADCEGLCNGGDNPDGFCISDLDCCGTDPTPDGTCELFTCDTLTSVQCVNAPIPFRCEGGDRDQRVCDPQAPNCPGGGQCLPGFEPGSQCDDGLECNGRETCENGICQAGTPLCADEPPEFWCNEDTNSCRPPCLTDDECDTDELECTNDLCDLKTCQGGANAGALCQFDPDCDSLNCGGGTGECFVGPAPCGPGGGCTEPAGINLLICAMGRCCDASGTCSIEKFADCTSPGDLWLATSSACAVLQPSGNTNDCPAYGSGVSPQGDFVVPVGPVSNSQCDIVGLGDEYTVDPSVIGGSWIQITFLRFAASVQSSVRLSVEFWDVSGSPLLIENVFFPDGQNAGVSGAAIRTLDFDPPLTIPASGVVAFSVQTNFGPDGAFSILSTDGADLGTNITDQMFVNGSLVTDFLGECSGGGRDGLWCDRGQPADLVVGCPGLGATCDDVPDVLAFEIVAKPGTSPLGACCNADTGVCNLALPWVCEAGGGAFQGPGTFCNFCIDDPFEACSANNDCWNCQGGGNDGDPCPNGNGDCDSDVCDQTPICFEVPPACQITACCDKGTGNCREVQGGFCSGDGTACADNQTCVDLGLGSCVGGFCNGDGTACITDFNCTGLGTCEAPCAKGENPQGFGSRCDPANQDFLRLGASCCEQPKPTGGDNCTLVDIPVINVPLVGEPPVVYTTTGNNSAATFDDFPDFCDFGMFDPDGGTRDPGWWEAFSITDCADVRWQLCCSDKDGEPLRPAWGGIFTGCPCEGVIGSSGAEPPIGVGTQTSGFARGEPFCGEDNLWETFESLPKGIYYYPLYSAPDGSFASPPGGQYQFNVVVGACAIAACCHLACDNDGLPCTTDADCGAGNCVSSCSEVNELECDELEGYWMARANLPDGIDDIVTCDFNPCDIGSCCRGAGACDDEAITGVECDRNNPVTCMDFATCDISGGTYIGGPQCQFGTPLQPSCPVCTVDFETGCQDSGSDGPGFVIVTTINKSIGDGPFADDFVAKGAGITQLCWTSIIASTTLGVCSPDQAPPDAWEIKFYSDNNGVPGTLLADSPTGVVELSGKENLTDPGQETTDQWYQFSVTFEPAISVAPGERYWVSVLGNGTEDCHPWAISSTDGNRYSFVEADAGSGWSLEDRWGLPLDFTWCIETGGSGGFDTPDPPIGACCKCNGDCLEDLLWSDCSGGTNFFGGEDFVTIGEELGQTAPYQTCTDISATCVTQGAGGACPGGPPIEGEDCEFPALANDGPNEVSTVCSTTDGRTSYRPVGCDNADIGTIEADQWYTYNATCNGEVSIDLCGDADWDVVMAVFTNGTATCPDTCPPPLADLVGDQCVDFECNQPDPSVTAFTTVQNQCFLIRVAGEGGDRGRGLMEIGCEIVSCFPSDTPVTPTVLEERTLVGAQNTATTGASVKNRYITVSGGIPGRKQVLRVRVVNLPAPYDVWNGMDFWVDNVREICENGGAASPPCPQEPNLPKDTFWAATLTCDLAEALKRDWTTLDLPLHIYHQVIIPSRFGVKDSVYEVAFAEEGCVLDDDASYSAPPLVVTAPRWGDVLDACNKDPCSPPQGVTNIGDVTGVLAKFQNLPGAPIKARTDLVGLPGNEGELDRVISIVDVTWDLDAFIGGKYEFAITDPCDGS